MKIGLDFDNTIVGYDSLFARVAIEGGLVPPQTPPSKLAVRDHLRQTGREPVWTELQGVVYGARMMEAEAFPGVLDFMAWARGHGIALSIVSHRTRQPFLGPPFDLHQAARDWTARFLTNAVIPDERIFFETTKDAKLARIAEGGFDYFLDDLPEILTAPGFPAATTPLLFGAAQAPAGMIRLADWDEVRAFVAARC